MTATPRLDALDTVEQIDAVIALTHGDITWRDPDYAPHAWEAIDGLLDRRNRLTRRT